MKRWRSVLTILGLAVAGLSAAMAVQAQFPGRGDDVTPSLGQFNVVVDPHYEDMVRSIPAYAPYLSNKGGHLNFTSPILFDPTTTIGRSDPLSSGSAADTAGVLAGDLTSRLLGDDQFPVRPSFAEGPDGTREVHTFIESIHLTGSGFEVRAGSQAPLRPLSAGEVESLSGNSGDPTQDFPANSFFDVFVQVDVPGPAGPPNIELVNVDPLLVESESITSFPPKVLYIHGNTSAVPLYFYSDISILGVHRGDLFGQLTLAGHGVGFRESDVAEFEAAEAESEVHHGRLPLQDNPVPHVTIVDEVPAPTPTPTPTVGACVGDCDGNGAVVVNEIIALVNIALGNAQPSTCPHGIPNGAEINIALLIQTVNSALVGCSA
jgi:hypothetical protein